MPMSRPTVTAVTATVEPNATLHDALEEMLLSNAGQAVVVDGKEVQPAIVEQ